MKELDLMEITIQKVHQAMKEGKLTCRQLTEFYLERIERYDRKGPSLKSVILVNPRALQEAEELEDRARKYPSSSSVSTPSCATLLP